MGLFDKVLGTSTDKLTEAEAFTGVVFCAVASDGVITPEEMNGLATTLGRMKLYGGTSNRDIAKIFDKIQRVFKERGFEGTLEMAANTLPHELKPTAFAVTADLLLADGHVNDQERQFLERLQKHLDINDDLALKTVEIIEIKNRG